MQAWSERGGILLEFVEGLKTPGKDDFEDDKSSAELPVHKRVVVFGL